jgi:hypothetical protein
MVPDHAHNLRRKVLEYADDPITITVARGRQTNLPGLLEADECAGRRCLEILTPRMFVEEAEVSPFATDGVSDVGVFQHDEPT